MRDIKFRAWHLETNEMLFVGDDKGTTHLLDCCKYKMEGQPVELMQFTGLKDRNGVEIYEGDVLRISEDAPEFDAVVSWNGICASFACYLLNDKHKEIYCDHMCGGETASVIGNIYENPELLNNYV